MLPTPPDSPPDALATAARACRVLRLLILFGSRARGDARPGADWDCGYLADETLDQRCRPRWSRRSGTIVSIW